MNEPELNNLIKAQIQAIMQRIGDRLVTLGYAASFEIGDVPGKGSIELTSMGHNLADALRIMIGNSGHLLKTLTSDKVMMVLLHHGNPEIARALPEILDDPNDKSEALKPVEIMTLIHLLLQPSPLTNN